jgi:hypothetical protein
VRFGWGVLVGEIRFAAGGLPSHRPGRERPAGFSTSPERAGCCGFAGPGPSTTLDKRMLPEKLLISRVLIAPRGRSVKLWFGPGVLEGASAAATAFQRLGT